MHFSFSLTLIDTLDTLAVSFTSLSLQVLCAVKSKLFETEIVNMKKRLFYCLRCLAKSLNSKMLFDLLSEIYSLTVTSWCLCSRQTFVFWGRFFRLVFVVLRKSRSLALKGPSANFYARAPRVLWLIYTAGDRY